VPYCLPSSDDEIDKHLVHLKTSFIRGKILSITKIFIIKAFYEILMEVFAANVFSTMDEEIYEEFGGERCGKMLEKRMESNLEN
jgi:hypothetical protein